MKPNELETILREKLSASFVHVEDESGRHKGHAGAMSGGGHFRVIVVSNRFANQSLMERHQQVYGAVGMGKNPDIHALAIQAFTEEEWRARS
jgi:BolA family transcriptional regulator, general stress-responsive regulator